MIVGVAVVMAAVISTGMFITNIGLLLCSLAT